MAKPKIVDSSEEDNDSNNNYTESPAVDSEFNDDDDDDDEDEGTDEPYHGEDSISRLARERRRSKLAEEVEQDEEDEDEDEEEDEDEDEEDEQEEDDLLESSEEEDPANDENFNIDDIEEDLEPKDEFEAEDDEDIGEVKVVEPIKTAPHKSIKIKIKPPTMKPDTTSKPTSSTTTTTTTTEDDTRSSRKRQVNYYQDDGLDFSDDLSDVDDIPPPIKKIKIRTIPEPKTQPQDLDPDLILTDEENEYNINSANDISKMTERQRARYNTETSIGLEDQYLELDASGKKSKAKKQTKIETEEEVALRKAENARKRLDYKNKMLEEEKRDTLNKLLKRRATKSREIITDDREGTPGEELNSFYKERRPMLKHPAFIRYVNNTTTLKGNSVLAYNE
ncbi:hypothetical protein KGF54_003373 [Candida jiufengensis]|uniref:uncharacterized protein n=1 Tax=Candida jiufengensis TaxID=497108 RepID=UPI00222541F0|nr:uncharacterized protein KGF54_003373 [Candida jiufengensis]KAI5952506.1 hypothetical protein KGF54_003373 [Candida jiufengensis]